MPATSPRISQLTTPDSMRPDRADSGSVSAMKNMVKRLPVATVLIGSVTIMPADLRFSAAGWHPPPCNWPAWRR
ncbi:hypothetical protein GCM10012287_34020 [Streptomyces daqingensis]|uniref:Uncharacterized protein n=1 Tax=Streptomyces daqingensis TaxID=1472640 RepID=A0ABQ2MHA1_9ACTN|nr:hypothetical protein GCM10012287_34020 [Streptomyces daqingensis]